MVTETLTLRAGGIEIDTRPEAFGFLRDSNDPLGDSEGLRARMDADGYLFLPGFFDDFLEGQATHFDYTWLRAISPGKGTTPHCDIVFMGRGTRKLFTCWTPLGDVPLNVGGMVLIEGSHKDPELGQTYCKMDVDTACESKPSESQLDAAGFSEFGSISSDISGVRSRVGGRLLTSREYRMGDLLIFTAFTVHGSLDNGSQEIRLSADSRYQLASEPLDERWIGEKPPGHGTLVRGAIC